MRLHYEFTADVTKHVDGNKFSWKKNVYIYVYIMALSSINLQKCQDPFLFDSILNDTFG